MKHPMQKCMWFWNKTAEHHIGMEQQTCKYCGTINHHVILCRWCQFLYGIHWDEFTAAKIKTAYNVYLSHRWFHITLPLKQWKPQNDYTAIFSQYAIYIMVQNCPSQSVTALLNPSKCIPLLSALFVISSNERKQQWSEPIPSLHPPFYQACCQQH